MSKSLLRSGYNRSKCCPVRPVIQRETREDEGWESPEDAPLLPDTHEVVVVDYKDLVDAETGEVSQQAEPLPTPKVLTKAEVEAHNVTHFQYRSWCQWCVMARRRNSPHSHTQSRLSRRSMPLLVADYCHIRDCQNSELATVLVAKLYPAKAMLAVVVDQKRLKRECHQEGG